jgi:hypothetical protein
LPEPHKPAFQALVVVARRVRIVVIVRCMVPKLVAKG